MRTLFLLIFLAGLGAGFVYPWALTSFSGREIGTWQVYERGGAFRPVTTTLSPADDPVRVLVDMISLDPPEFGARRATLNVTASTGGRTVLTDTVTFAEAKPQERSPQLRDRIYRDEAGIIAGVEGGDYTFVVDRGSRERIDIRSVSLILRGGALSADPRIRQTGYGMAGVGLVGFVFSARRRKRALPSPQKPRWGRAGSGNDDGQNDRRAR